MHNTNLYYKDAKGDLRSLSYGENDKDLEAVQDQGALVSEIIELGMTTPVSPVLCAVEGSSVADKQLKGVVVK